MRNPTRVLLFLVVFVALALVAGRYHGQPKSGAPSAAQASTRAPAEVRTVLLDSEQPWFQPLPEPSPAPAPAIVLPIAARTSVELPPAGSREIPPDVLDYLLVSQQVLRDPLPREHPFYGRHFEMIDLRSPEAFARGHIPFSHNAPYEGLGQDMKEGFLSRLERECILVVLGDRYPTEDVSRTLLEGGYRQVYLLSGGWETWVARGYRQEESPAPPAVIPSPPPAVHEEPEPMITAEELRERLRGPSPPLLAFVSPIEELYTSGHIPGAIYVPLPTVKEYFSGVPKDREVVFYCGCCKGKTKGLSGQAVQELRGMGFRQVVHLLGHLEAWQLAGYELRTGKE